MRFRLPPSLLPLLALGTLLCATSLPAAADSARGAANRFTPSHHAPLPAALPECRYPRLVTEIPSSPYLLLTSTVREFRKEHLSSDLTSNLTLINSTSSNAETPFIDLFAALTETFERMGYPAQASLVTIHSPVANAFVRKNREVVITTALLTRIRERSEIAFILAHELAHVALSHDSSGGIPAELAADTLALRVITALSFDPCSGSSVLERLGRPSELTLASLQPRLTALHNKTFDLCG